ERLSTRLYAAASALRRLDERLNGVAVLFPYTGAKCLAVAAQAQIFLAHLVSAPKDQIEALLHLRSVRGGRLREIDNNVRAFRELIAEVGEEIGTFQEAGLKGDPASIRNHLVGGTASLFRRWGRAYRYASAVLASWLNTPLPRTAQERVSTVDRL